MKKVYIIHGWGGSPEEEIHKWLKKELELRDFEVVVPTMPYTETPKIKEWIFHLQQNLPSPNEQIFFVGHSIGCQTILRYLENLSAGTKIGGAVLLAPWMNLLDTAYESPEEEKEIARPWIETPINLENVKSHCDKFTCIFSDDDPCVGLEEKNIFEEKLKAKIIIEENKGHFTMEGEVSQVPSVLNEILEMSK